MKMYITKEELDRRITKTSVQVNERTRKSRNGININGVAEKRLDNSDRILIGALNEIDTQKNIAELLDVSQTTVSNASRGFVGISTGINKELKEGVNSKIEEIAKEKLISNKQLEDQLLTNLSSALGQVAGNINRTNAPEASKIAVDMSKILDRVTGDKESKGNRTAIIINVPAMKEEKHYSSITV